MNLRFFKHLAAGTAISLVLLMIIELTFRLGGVGKPVRAFLAQQIGNHEYLSFNTNYMYQYYQKLNQAIPAPATMLFAKNKPDSVFRIVVLGESTGLGFPYSSTEAFPFQLEQILNLTEKGLKFEVINLSMSAITSYIGWELSKEVVELKPDLAIFYFGHNEFVGIGGGGIADNPIFRLNRLLSGLRFYQWLKSLNPKNKENDSRSLIEASYQKPGITYGSKSYLATVNSFQKYYTKLIRVYQKERIPVIALGIVGNRKDFPPFRHDPLPEGYDNEFYKEKAAKISELPELIGLCGGNAGCYFQMGAHFFESGKVTLASNCYDLACNLDLIRFRATTTIDSIISQVATETGSFYLDLKPVFAHASPSGFPDNSLLVEHVHPDLYGHNIIARNLAVLIHRDILQAEHPEEFPNFVLYSTLVDKFKAASISFSLFQTEIFRKTGFFNPLPFQGLYHNPVSLDSIGNAYVVDAISEEYARIRDYMVKHGFSSLVHLNMGNWYLLRKKYDEAFMEYLTGHHQDPHNQHLRNNLGILYFQSYRRDTGIRHLEFMREMGNQDPNILANLVLMYTITGNTQKLTALKSELRERKERLPAPREQFYIYGMTK